MWHHIMQLTIDENGLPDPNGCHSNHYCCSSTHFANFSLDYQYIPVVTFDSILIRIAESAQSNCCPIDYCPHNFVVDNIVIGYFVDSVECISMHSMFANRSARTDLSYFSIASAHERLYCPQNSSMNFNMFGLPVLFAFHMCGFVCVLLTIKSIKLRLSAVTLLISGELPLLVVLLSELLTDRLYPYKFGASNDFNGVNGLELSL